METIYHSKIQVKTIAKNGSEKFGAVAECKAWLDEKIKFDVTQNGKTKDEAKEKLIHFLTDGGQLKAVCVEESEAINPIDHEQTH